MVTESSVIKRPSVKDRRMNTQQERKQRVTQTQQLDVALSEVEQKCSREVYEVVYLVCGEQKMQKERMAGMRAAENEWERATKENVLLKQTSSELQNKLKVLETQIKTQ